MAMTSTSAPQVPQEKEAVEGSSIGSLASRRRLAHTVPPHVHGYGCAPSLRLWTWSRNAPPQVGVLLLDSGLARRVLS